MQISLTQAEEFEIKFRVPFWSKASAVIIDGHEMASADGQFFSVQRLFKNGDLIEVVFDVSLRVEKINGKVAFLWGPLTLARDTIKESNSDFIKHPIAINGGMKIKRKIVPKKNGEQIRLTAALSGEQEILLTDYASCGRDWTDENSIVSVTS